MKITKTASGKQKLKLSKAEWKAIGKKAGWMKVAGSIDFDQLELLAKELFPELDDMGLDNIVNAVLKNRPQTHEEAVALLKSQRERSIAKEDQEQSRRYFHRRKEV